MMRRWIVLSGLLGACLAIGLAGAQAAGGAWRSWLITAAPAPQDYSLLEVSFAHVRADRVGPSSAKVAVRGPFGADYLAAAAVRSPASREGRALVLVVDRPSALLDPARVTLRVQATRSLGAATVLRVGDVLARGDAGSHPSLCDLRLDGAALQQTGLRALGGRGGALSGFGAAGAVAQAYDLACGLAHSSVFEADVKGCSSEATCGAPAPTPEPVPAPRPPGCAPCDPRPGYACPLAARTDVCVASRRTSGQLRGLGDH